MWYYNLIHSKKWVTKKLGSHDKGKHQERNLADATLVFKLLLVYFLTHYYSSYNDKIWSLRMH